MLELIKVSDSKFAQVKSDLVTGLPAVLGDAPQLRQVVMNLVMNASDALVGKGVIRIATSHATGGRGLPTELPKGDYVKLEVSDNGSGMPEEVRARIFTSFFTTKSGGRGRGLAVVQGIVRAHHGVINLVSAPGEGTAFQIFLPCLADRGGR